MLHPVGQVRRVQEETFRLYTGYKNASGLFEGPGILIFSRNDLAYSGEFNSRGQFEGDYGILRDKQEIYMGPFSGNLFHGPDG